MIEAGLEKCNRPARVAFVGAALYLRRSVLGFLKSLFVLVLWCTALFHCVTYLLWFYESRRGGGPDPRRKGIHLWTAWFAEWAALILIVLTHPIGLFTRSTVKRASGGARPVVLIHGWSLNRASMALLAARLRADGRPAYTINYPSMVPETDAKAAAVARAVKQIARDSGSDRVDVVAHSLGGIVVRAAARWHGADAVLGNVVKLGSPHRGSAVALLLRSFGILQLRPGSRFLQRLEDEETPPAIGSLTAIASDFDAIAHPLECCHCPSALNITVEAIGHHAILFTPRVYQLVKENLDTPLAVES
jgi:pimeloyl-ACP methyl ester carboxylesterase